ncbi:class I SAM-dependent methyltransferase [Flavobacterium sp.]|jgi:ubiquinone/menaquinone biosynthesis C-methylase UbiE|uniref:class I SAM-dependent methyltransferase n=1 Tax=Flavobacterium sp. TaxID=239 RepID=UPI0037BEF7B0
MENKFVGFEEMSVDELWDFIRLEYQSQNPISKKLYANFYKKIDYILENYLKENDSLLEVGCGAAESSLRIHSKLSSLKRNIAFEASEYDNRYVQKINSLNYPFKVTQENVYSLQRNDNEYNLIFLLEVLEHLEFPEKAISELFRVSSKYVLISVPNEPIWRIANMARFQYVKDFGNTPGHINHFNQKKLTKIVKPYGKVIKVFKPFPWLIMLVEKH